MLEGKLEKGKKTKGASDLYNRKKHISNLHAVQSQQRSSIRKG
jgi:hypothetical protein